MMDGVAERYTCDPVGASHHWHEYPSPLPNVLEICCRCGSSRITLRRERERDEGNEGCLAEVGTTDFIRVNPDLPNNDLLEALRGRLEEFRSDLFDAITQKGRELEEADQTIRERGQALGDALDAKSSQFDAAIANHQDRLDQAGLLLEDHRDRLDAQGLAMQTRGQTLQEHAGRLDQIDAYLTGWDERISATEADISRLQTGGGTLRTDVNSLVVRASKLEADLAQAQSDMLALQTQMINRTNQDRARLTTLEANQAKIITKIGGIP